MAAQFPNPIPLFISGSASKAAATTISSQGTDLDGSDATQVYSLSDPYYFGLLRKVKIYSRGSNGAGTAYLWVDDGSDGTKECIGQISWDSTDRGLVRLSGSVVYMDMEGEDPDQERMRGYILRENTVLYVQISDGSISDGYRVHCEVRNMTEIPDLNGID